MSYDRAVGFGACMLGVGLAISRLMPLWLALFWAVALIVSGFLHPVLRERNP